MQDLAGTADAFSAARGAPRGGVEAEEPFGDAEGGGDFALVGGDEDAGGRRGGGGRGEHYPVFGAGEDGVPCAGGGVSWVLALMGREMGIDFWMRGCERQMGVRT